jgi:hypothetical protein
MRPLIDSPWDVELKLGGTVTIIYPGDIRIVGPFYAHAKVSHTSVPDLRRELEAAVTYATRDLLDSIKEVVGKVQVKDAKPAA